MRPGTSGALALTMANVIIEEGLFDRDFVENWTVGFEDYRAYVRTFPPVGGRGHHGSTGPFDRQAARLYATSKPAGLLSGANATVHHTNGVQNHRALTALIGLTGNFDREGGNYVVPPSYLYVPTGLITRQHQFEQSRPWEEMAPRIGQDTYPVWCKMVPEAQAMHLPFQIRSRTPYPVRAMVAFGLNHRMWPGSDFMRESSRDAGFSGGRGPFHDRFGQIRQIWCCPRAAPLKEVNSNFTLKSTSSGPAPLIKPLGESRSDADIIFDLAERIAPGDALMQKGYEACVDWILEPTDLRVEELRKYPAGCSLKETGMPPYRKYEKGRVCHPFR